MKLTKILIVVSVILFAFGCEKKDDHATMKNEGHTAQQEERLIYYTCPMDSHKHIHDRNPGKCTDCGMTLVAGVITSEQKMDYYGCPMLTHSHIRSEKDGNCGQCGMKLKPMRLVN